MDRPTLGSLVWHLSTRWRTEVDRVVAPMGLTHAQYSALATLDTMLKRGAEPSQNALAQRLGVTAIYASKLLRALEAGGLIRREADARDSRARRLTLTPQGSATIADARRAVTDLDRRLTAPLGDPDGPAAQAFRITLRALLDHTNRMDEQP